MSSSRPKPSPSQRPVIGLLNNNQKHAFDHSEAQRLYEIEHLSFAEISRRLKVSERSIRNACYAAGVAKPKTTAAAKNAKRKRATSNVQLIERFSRLTVGDPPIRADGCCAVCLEPRRPERSATYAMGCAEIDAFCSTECAREFHGNPIPFRPTHPNQEVTAA